MRKCNIPRSASWFSFGFGPGLKEATWGSRTRAGLKRPHLGVLMYQQGSLTYLLGDSPYIMIPIIIDTTNTPIILSNILSNYQNPWWGILSFFGGQFNPGVAERSSEFVSRLARASWAAGTNHGGMTLEDQALGRILNRGLLLGIPWYTSMTGMVYGIGYTTFF